METMYRLLVLALCFAGNPSFLYSQEWIIIDNSTSKECVSVDVLESNMFIYKAKIKIHKIKKKAIDIQGDRFYSLSFDNNNSLLEIGKPALPVIKQFIGLPNGASYSFNIEEIRWDTINIGPIFPAQKPTTGEKKVADFSIVDSIYNCSYYNPPSIFMSKTRTWKGIDNVYMAICPFRYYPIENSLSILTEFVFTVNFTSPKNLSKKKVNYSESDLCIFDNSDFLPTRTSESQQGQHQRTTAEYDYLIIVGNMPQIEGSQAMVDFRKWKAIKGHKTKLVSTSTIGSDTASIKQYICQEYANGINQVLFVGDHTKIPIHTCAAHVINSDTPIIMSDYWYGCINDDIQADIPIGRFLSNTLTDFSNMVNKTIQYESLNHDWADKYLLIANMQGAPRLYQAWLEAIRNQYSNTLDFYTAYAAPTDLHGDDARITDVCNYINTGISLVTYNGHGDDDAFWLTPNRSSPLTDIIFTNTDTYRLNAGTYPIFVSTGCSNGNFTSSNSFMCSMTRSDHCVSSFIGGTVPQYTNSANDYLLEFFNALIDDSNYHLGHLNVAAHISNFTDDSSIDNGISSICAGDPSLEVWTGDQKEFQQIDISLSLDHVIVTLDNSINHFSVNLISTDGVLLEHIESGTSNSCIFSKPVGNFKIALDKHNYIPLVLNVDIESQYIQNVTVSQNTYYIKKPIYIGYDVTNTKPYGNVTISSGAKVFVSKGQGVTIKNGFECQSGAEFIVQ